MDIYVLRITLGDWSAVHTYTEAEAAQEGAEDWLQKNAYPTGLVWEEEGLCLYAEKVLWEGLSLCDDVACFEVIHTELQE